MLLKLLKGAFKAKPSRSELEHLALTHHARGELELAEKYFREVVLQGACEASAWNNLAATLVAQRKYQEAIPVLQELIDMQPDLAEAHLDLGICNGRLKNNGQAITHLHRAIEIKPELAQAHAYVINAYMESCDWTKVAAWTNAFLEYRSSHPVRDWLGRVQPLTALSLFPCELTRELAVARANAIFESVAEDRKALLPRPAARADRPRIRIGYVSGDFYDHATAHLTFSLYESHDRDEFEVFAYSHGPDDGSTYRKHVERTCDRFIDVRGETVMAAAERIQADEIDILVDMKGHTAGARPQIFALRPAPLQVSYLGYPGTSGAPYIDYFITDRTATPAGFEREFTENLVYLPNCYQPNDNKQQIASSPLSRKDCGLPDNVFVFCCFNTLSKIDSVIFDAWMDIMRRVQDSVLWLIKEDPLAEVNLRREAANRGVNPSRLVFAPKIEKSAHLARHRLADLFLDTYIYNAHTTASDALWAGLPVLTCPGETFARRVAASLLSAANLSELIAPDLARYRELAIRIALDPPVLAELRKRLTQNHLSCPLFDTRNYVRGLEAAYRSMTEFQRRGTPPHSFEVRT